MATTTTGKRKRNQVSYLVDDNDELDAILVAEGISEEDASSDDDDGTFGSRKKAKPKKKKAKKTTGSKPKKEKPFRFLDLPAELRDEIYELTLTDPDGVHIVAGTKNRRHIVKRGTILMEDGSAYRGKYRVNRGRWGWYSRNDSKTTTIGEPVRKLVPNLLSVSKQIREEGSSMLYKQELVLEDMTALHTFLAQIGPYNRQLLSEVTVKGWGQGRGVQKASNYAAFTMLSTCTNIQSLFLDCSVGYSTRYPERLAQQLYRDAHHFLEAVGFANGKRTAGVKILEMSARNFIKTSEPETEEDEELLLKRTKQFRASLREALER